MNIFDLLAQKLNIKTSKAVGSKVTNPFDSDYVCPENKFLSKMSHHALNLYEKKCDIKQFTKLVLSDPDNTSHNEMVEKLFQEGVIDPLDDKNIKDLANNSSLLKDLDL